MRSIEQLTEELLALPHASRALLAEKLVESLEREKIDAALETSTHTPPLYSETFVNQILERFQQAG